MKIRYLRDVNSPEAQAGKTGEIREVEINIAKRLLKNGYAEDIEEPLERAEPAAGEQPIKEVEKNKEIIGNGNADEGTNSKSRGSKKRTRKSV